MSVGVAIFRYRLYDIDVILSRAIVLGVLAVFVTVGYIVVVVAIGAVLVAVGAPGSTLYWPSLVATALVAVAFQPVRQHVLRLADQLVYGNRAAPYEALASLSRRLADSPSPDALPARVAEATGRAVGAAGIVRAARRAAGTIAGAQRGLVRHRLARSGSMRVGCSRRWYSRCWTRVSRSAASRSPCHPGRALRTFERHLLEDVAAQAGVAFRNALLEAELAARVEQGKAQSAELAASRRRLLGAEDEARERLAGAIRRNVVPHLAAVDARTDGRTRTADQLPARATGTTRSAKPNVRSRNCEPSAGVCFPRCWIGAGWYQPCPRNWTSPIRTPCSTSTTPPTGGSTGQWRPPATCSASRSHRRTESLVKLRVDEDQLVAAVTGDIDWANDRDPMGWQCSRAWQHSRDRVAALDGAVNVQRNESGMTVTASFRWTRTAPGSLSAP